MPFTEDTVIETEYGELLIRFFCGENKETCLCIIKEPWNEKPFLRIHSACLFSETFASNDCDCAKQLHASLRYISVNGGAVIYLFQEGRGLGLEGKIKAINIQKKQGLDTAAAFSQLGHPPDLRNYDIAIEVLQCLNFPKEISLGTNNPEKIRALEDAGYLINRYKLQVDMSKKVKKYLKMKQDVLDHLDHE